MARRSEIRIGDPFLSKTHHIKFSVSGRFRKGIDLDHQGVRRKMFQRILMDSEDLLTIDFLICFWVMQPGLASPGCVTHGACCRMSSGESSHSMVLGNVLNLKKHQFVKKNELNHNPDAPCMEYLPTFGWFLGPILVDIPAPWFAYG